MTMGIGHILIDTRAHVLPKLSGRLGRRTPRHRFPTLLSSAACKSEPLDHTTMNQLHNITFDEQGDVVWVAAVKRVAHFAKLGATLGLCDRSKAARLTWECLLDWLLLYAAGRFFKSTAQSEKSIAIKTST